MEVLGGEDGIIGNYILILTKKILKNYTQNFKLNKAKICQDHKVLFENTQSLFHLYYNKTEYGGLNS